MKVFERLRKPEVEQGPESTQEPFRSLIPEDKQSKILKAALERLEITMYSGALSDAVKNVCAALVLEREYADDPDKLALSQAVIHAQIKDLGMHRKALEAAGGDRETAAKMSLDGIVDVVTQSYGASEQAPQGQMSSPNTPRPEPTATHHPAIA